MKAVEIKALKLNMIESVNIAEREQRVEMRANNEKNNLEDKVL